MNGPQTFRKKPIEVEAIQWTGKNPAAVRAFTGMHQIGNGGEHFVFTTQAGHGELFVAANDAWLDIEIGEWILRDERGFYPCKPEMFEQSYASVEKRVSVATYASTSDETAVADERLTPILGLELRVIDAPGAVAVIAPRDKADSVADAVRTALREAQS